VSIVPVKTSETCYCKDSTAQPGALTDDCFIKGACHTLTRYHLLGFPVPVPEEIVQFFGDPVKCCLS